MRTAAVAARLSTSALQLLESFSPNKKSVPMDKKKKKEETC